ncbi:MAG: hypothetical protein J4415_02985 [Candidatus Diapherotrites archaeon]|uniref:Uncharacterized protein n=1 Tax=Candidatus Iainarchaeum sp. TaxID=3101447 RepID=A0A8T4KT87_9ARCH|nr:hypothetical protein [Candidatus Diapherotrites archaeon]
MLIQIIQKRRIRSTRNPVRKGAANLIGLNEALIGAMRNKVNRIWQRRNKVDSEKIKSALRQFAALSQKSGEINEFLFELDVEQFTPELLGNLLKFAGPKWRQAIA